MRVLIKIHICEQPYQVKEVTVPDNAFDTVLLHCSAANKMFTEEQLS